MDIVQLRYFSKVYEMKNYAQSAMVLHISRQALRQSVGNLERELCGQLFTVERNKLVPTPLARDLYLQSRDVLASFESLEQAIKPRRQLRSVGWEPSTGDLYSADERTALSQLVFENPREDVTFKVASPADLRAMVLDGDIEMATYIGFSVNESLFEHTPMKEGRLYALVNRLNPLAMNPFLRIEDLRGVKFASQGRGFDVHEHLAKACEERGFELDLALQNDSLLELANVVRVSEYVTYAYQPVYDDDSLATVPFDDPSISWMLMNVVRKGRENVLFVDVELETNA